MILFLYSIKQYAVEQTLYFIKINIDKEDCNIVGVVAQIKGCPVGAQGL